MRARNPATRMNKTHTAIRRPMSQVNETASGPNSSKKRMPPPGRLARPESVTDALEVGRGYDRQRKRSRQKCHGRPYITVGGRPWMALGTPKVIKLYELKTRSRGKAMRFIVGGYHKSQDTGVPRTCSWLFCVSVAIILFIG